MTGALFHDRENAGRQLAARLLDYQADFPVVLALPRGGVPVAAPIAKALRAPLDLVLVRKLGAPHNPELAIGAVAGTAGAPQWFLHDELIRHLAVPEDYIRRAAERELAVIDRRRRDYVGDRAPVPLEGRVVIIVDDGIATGATAGLALRIVRQAKPSGVVLAAPVAPPSALGRLRDLYDRAVCVMTPEDFSGVGQFYEDFRQTTDAEVVCLLRGAVPDDGLKGGHAKPR